jgi:hypothetical protein
VTGSVQTDVDGLAVFPGPTDPWIELDSLFYMLEKLRWLTTERVLAVLPFQEFAGHALLSPDLLPCPFRVFGKVCISLRKIEVDSVLGGPDARVVAVIRDFHFGFPSSGSIRPVAHF